MSKTEIINLQIESDAYTIQLRKDGIVHSHIKDSVGLDKVSVKDFNSALREILGTKKAPLLITFDDFAFPSARIRKFWALKQSCPLSLAEAYVVNNFGHKLIGRVYLKDSRPLRPTKIFSNLEDALSWLKFFQ